MWQPNADIAMLTVRAKIMAAIRTFFAEREVLEVETPALSQATVTDLHLASFVTEFVGPGHAKGLPLYLQTSPEFAMKRLLAAGSGCIYQIGKAFRNEEAGRYHNPEFTMLEWYRVGFDHFALMDEMDALLQLVLGCEQAQRISYRQVFMEQVGVDPLECDIEALKAVLRKHNMADIAELENDPDTLMQLIFSEVIEANIGQQRPCFVYHFPASQAALARLHDKDKRVAERFEVYFKGIELANGFHELTDADEQCLRFEQDNQKRREMGRVENRIDQRFIEALESGMPPCAGVALGIDRLVMLATKSKSIDRVIAFTVDRA